MINPAHVFNKLIVFFNPDKATYWHTITRNTLNNRPSELGRFYLNFESKLDYPGKIDLNGIPLYSNKDNKEFHHPIVICQYALGIFEHLYQSNYHNEDLKKKFLQQVDWLEQNSIAIKHGTVWYWNFNLEIYSLYKPWFSGLTQGEAVSVLTRAFLITNKEKYLRIAGEAVRSLNVPVSEGGLLNYFNNLPIYEEYPSPKKTVGNLCGFMFTLFGLHDLKLISNDKLAGELFEKGISSLKKLLQYYDMGYWSKYYLFDYPNSYTASFTYHSLHFEQLMSLYFITGEKVFFEYSEKWRSYSENYYYKMKALVQKITYAKTLE